MNGKVIELRAKADRAETDPLKAYAEAVNQHAEAALDGNPVSIAWVKSQLRAWVQGDDPSPPPGVLLRVAALHFLAGEAIAPVRRAEGHELPKELDAANIAFQAVCNGAGGPDEPFKDRIKFFVRSNWPDGAFSEEALERIARVANRDTKTGPKRRKPSVS